MKTTVPYQGVFYHFNVSVDDIGCGGCTMRFSKSCITGEVGYQDGYISFHAILIYQLVFSQFFKNSHPGRAAVV